MVLYRSVPPPDAPADSRAITPRSSIAALRRFAFDDGVEHVDCGSAVLLSPDARGSDAASATDEEPLWSAAQTAAFLAGDPVTFSWITPSPRSQDGQQAYVCCWVTLGD